MTKSERILDMLYKEYDRQLEIMHDNAYRNTRTEQRCYTQALATATALRDITSEIESNA